MERTLHLSECERSALKTVLFLNRDLELLLTQDEKFALARLLEDSAPKRPSVRFVVFCTSGYAGKKWEKTYYDKTAAQTYARYALGRYGGSVKIQRQKWVSF